MIDDPPSRTGSGAFIGLLAGMVAASDPRGRVRLRRL